MIFSRPGRPIFPLLPPYGAHDPNDGHGRIIPLNPDGITPYLGLRARLSQVWINRWTILLLLVLVRVLIAISSLQDDIASAEREALAACTSIESMGSAMASMPHYLSRGVNELTASGVESAVGALHSMLMLTVTGVEELVVFVLQVMFQTYLCLITLAVRGSVHVAVGVIEEATDFLNSTVQDIGEDISDAVSSFEEGLNDFLSGINSIASAFGGNVPTLDIDSSLEELESLHLPSSIDDNLEKLNSSIPTFDEVRNFTESLIRLPFDEVKQLMNESLGPYNFDRSVLPVPAKEKMTFCDENDAIDDFFRSLQDIASTARKIFVAVLVAAATLACVPVAWQEIRRWRTMKERSQLVRKEAHDPMDVVYIVSRPHTAAAGIKAASHFSNSRRQILVRWAIAYATSAPALFVLCLGIAGLLSCLCQYILLQSVQGAVPELTAQVSAFADMVVDSLQQQSAEWAREANSAIGQVNQELNNEVFGWVNTSTNAVNGTLNTFVEETTSILNSTFGGTLLYEPITGVFNCLIGLKVESVQNGLTWVSNHAHIDFPKLPNDTLSSGAAESVSGSNKNASDSFLADVGDTTSNKITEVVVSFINKIEAGIRTETIISAVVVLIWVVIALIGVIRALVLFWGREKPRGEGAGLPAVHMARPGGGDPGFDVPLATVPNQSARHYPTPGYDANAGFAADAMKRGSDDIDGNKFGFAGHRPYGTAVTADGAQAGRGSSYAEYGMEKR
ncbi:hypothetical protein PHISP_06962 [Aspergillus sp. HF37]|nr:hypothetical protein PHISP_06962 [Aspergillus sp. HF37]